ncbi:alpha/beta hydrolase [Tyzzerella sp. OttesenSCG-928-J15]|nr:alpha/beta hydrolase [Ruminococcaceae bacterium OttesenSCG-928-L11]MDL2248707.1 alpha/beta hydrolase [Tyzzerella sp. OttesenSCG-928-J15]
MKYDIRLERVREPAMQKQNLIIDGIPAALWGDGTEGLYVAVHGDQSHKEDAIIAIFAGEAAKKGFRTLSFDLPEHGDRENENRLCSVQNCIEDLHKIMNHACTLSDRVRLFGCSMGAYFSMMAYKDEPIRNALLLSPVVDMRRIIENMMLWFDVSLKRLEREQEIATPIKTLYWDYYKYVVDNPVRWDKPTAILYGEKDELCEYEYVSAFAERSGADLTVVPGGEHFFHTNEHLAYFRNWLHGHIDT